MDENLPSKIQFVPSLPIIHVSALGKSFSDTEIWQYAKEKNLVIITKDVDFSDRLMLDSNPPKESFISALEICENVNFTSF
ncbi:MAG: DUF5615 family PIN-like protein [Woronichinia naegeliana WA131]|uniref:DUF5615 family PIN-like protein n=1 Tax=Woronichinia naegeliana WA131 TaxID=2824559 RepID=A0A977KXB6_9CYAN|nr:MAG: DUF5615 family PIN-like protein [Woronichinia naegeliana WA131]